MVSTVLCSGQLSLPAQESYVLRQATKAQSVEQRWQLVLMALSHWKEHRLYVVLDTTVLWNHHCMIHLSVVCCGRAVPLLAGARAWQCYDRICGI